MDCIITSIYRLEPYKRPGFEDALTRNMMPHHYVAGVRSLYNLGKDVIVFYNKQDVVVDDIRINIPEICNVIIPGASSFSNVKFIPFDLKTEYSRFNNHQNQCIHYADKNPSKLYCWNSPLECSKMELIYKVLTEYHYDNVAWFDAGLSNISYIPSKYGGTEHSYQMQDWNKYYPINVHDIFNSALGNRVFEIIKQHGSLICGTSNVTQECRKFIKYNMPAVNVSNQFSMTGCILGFNIHNIQYMMKQYHTVLDRFIDMYDDIFTEIDVFTYLNAVIDYPKLIWNNYSPSPDMYVGSMVETLREKIYTNESIRFNNSIL